MNPKTDPATIRALLDEAEQTSPYATARRHRLHPTALYRWQKRRIESGGAWPTDQDIADWHTYEPKRRRQAEIHGRYKKRRYAAGTRPLQIPALGTRRRLQALARLGHTGSDIAAALDLSPARISQLMRGNRSGRYVLTETAAAVAEVFERLCMTIPQGWTHDRARRAAERAGWPPPLAWSNIDDPDEQPRGACERNRRKTEVDPVAIERAMAGDHMNLTRAERFAVVARLRADGWSLKRIEAHTGMTKAERYIEREEVAS